MPVRGFLFFAGVGLEPESRAPNLSELAQEIWGRGPWMPGPFVTK